METGIVQLDTHLVVWLYSGNLELIPVNVAQLLEKSLLRISPIVALEIQYLYETRRITVKAAEILEDLEMRIGLRWDTLSFTRVVRQSMGETWTHDPFDRLIVAQARIRQLPLITKDRMIQKHYKKAQW